MNLSHNKFSEESGENLGLGISEIQITLLCLWLDYGANEKGVTAPSRRRIVYVWKRFRLLHNPGIYHDLLNISCNTIFPFEEALKEKKKMGWGTRSKRNLRWLRSSFFLSFFSFGFSYFWWRRFFVSLTLIFMVFVSAEYTFAWTSEIFENIEKHVSILRRVFFDF